jgi:hypothetical protein
MAQNMQNMSAEGLANLAKEAAAAGQDPQEAVADFVQQTLEAAQAVEPTISSNLGNLQLKSTKGKKTKRFKNKVAGNVNIQALVESQVQERLRAIEQEKKRMTNGKVFSRFDTAIDVVGNVKEAVSAGIWSDGTGTLSNFFINTTQSGSTGRYFLDVSNLTLGSSGSAVQFSVAYGNRQGSGSQIVNVDKPTKAIYSQYSQTLLAANDGIFTMEGSVNTDEIFILNFERARQKEKVDPGNWQLTLSGSSGTENKGGLRTFIDDSGATTNPTINEAGRVFNIVSGSISSGIKTAAASETGGGVGLFYPDQGVLIFNAGQFRPGNGMDISLRTGGPTGGIGSGSSVHNDNHFKFFSAVSASGAAGSGFQARNEEDVTSTHYFVRVRNQEFNYSNNPTFTSGSNGSFRFSTMKDDPRVYITSVGLYDDANQLLATAKLSKPQLKSFAKELLVKVKLDY